MEKVLICGPCAEDRIDGISCFGGAGGGIALNLAKQHIPVGLLSVLGEDTFSKKYQELLQQLHVETSLLSASLKQLPIMTLLTRENSEKARDYQANGVREALSKLIPSKDTLQSYDFLHVVNTPRELADYLADNFSGTISYCPGSLLVRDPKSLSESLLRKATYLFCNEEEYAVLQSLGDIQSLFQGKLAYVFVTKGEQGIDILTATNVKHMPALAIDNVVDTTGAGDAIVVGFIRGIFQNKTIEESIYEGKQFAAKVIQKHGILIE